MGNHILYEINLLILDEVNSDPHIELAAHQAALMYANLHPDRAYAHRIIHSVGHWQERSVDWAVEACKDSDAYYDKIRIVRADNLTRAQLDNSVDADPKPC